MTKEEWSTSVDPDQMLLWVIGLDQTRRKSRLYACACCRRIWSLVTDLRSRDALEVAERYADGFASESELSRAQNEADQAAEEAEELNLLSQESGVLLASTNAIAYAADLDPLAAARWARKAVVEQNELGQQVIESDLLVERELEFQAAIIRDLYTPFQTRPNTARNEDPGVKRIARAIYDARRFDAMRELSAAFLSAGITDREVVEHCRSGLPHAKGCWVLDQILGIPNS